MHNILDESYGELLRLSKRPNVGQPQYVGLSDGFGDCVCPGAYGHCVASFISILPHRDRLGLQYFT